MPLHDSWVDRIFDRLTLAYGQAFIRQWEGMDIAAVKAFWSEELDGLSAPAIGYALSVLNPDRPPNAPQFKALCLKAPQYKPKALPAPPADPAVVEAVMAGFKRSAAMDAKAWAWRLKEREEAGAMLTIAQREMWRAALGAQASAQDTA